jgi:hypothetical protein
MEGQSYTALCTGLCHKGGVLAPSAQATRFDSLQAARRAVERTYRMARRLGVRSQKTILGDWLKIQSMYAKGTLDIVPLNKDGSPYVPKILRPHQLDDSYRNKTVIARLRY